ncbi:hypothetical protein ACJMK2_040593 [Sinanodonta woodiana]|uniref:Ankyrin repeat protein n=1 Tax=Sinanodonta woodiana TaxID=1069815 RepID=A0ABD3W558_SINWO
MEINETVEDTELQDNGLTPLMVAVKENKLVVVERLIELGVNLNDRAKDGRTVMHFAAAYAKDDIIKLLITKKADLSILGGAFKQSCLTC